MTMIDAKVARNMGYEGPKAPDMAGLLALLDMGHSVEVELNKKGKSVVMTVLQVYPVHDEQPYHIREAYRVIHDALNRG